MVHSVGKSAALRQELQSTDLMANWHPSIGRAVLENWRVGEVIADAVGEQDNHDRRHLHSTDLTDILIVSVILARTMGKELPAEAEMAKVSSFRSLALTREECAMTLKHAEYQLASLQDALGC
jgi:HD-like signal output (HDOD) protein